MGYVCENLLGGCGGLVLLPILAGFAFVMSGIGLLSFAHAVCTPVEVWRASGWRRWPWLLLVLAMVPSFWGLIAGPFYWASRRPKLDELARDMGHRQLSFVRPFVTGWAFGCLVVGTTVFLWWPTGHAAKFAQQMSIIWAGTWLYAFMWFAVRNGLSLTGKLFLVAWLLVAFWAAGDYARHVIKASCTYVGRWQSPLCEPKTLGVPTYGDLAVPIKPAYMAAGGILGGALLVAGARHRTTGG